MGDQLSEVRTSNTWLEMCELENYTIRNCLLYLLIHSTIGRIQFTAAKSMVIITLTFKQLLKA